MLRILFSCSFLLFILCGCNDDDQVNPQGNLIVDASFESSSTGLDILPANWENCGDLLPDIFPVENNTREVDKTAFDGDNYIGLRVSENDEFSCIFHLFDQPIIAGDSLIISLSLARSSVYLIETNGEMVNFATPAVLRVFGMTVDQDILLYNSPLAINTRWLTKTKTIASNEDIIGIKLKAFYQTPSPFPYNGNVLIDNLDFRLKR